MKNKAMVIGAIDAGKTTLINGLIGNVKTANKTQTLSYHQWIVDTPGEYTENPLYYKSIMATAFQVTHIIYVQDASAHKNIFPPGFGGGIPKLGIGVVTKSDVEDSKVDKAVEMLKRVMLKGPIIITSAKNKTGLHHIKPLVQCNSYSEMKKYVEAQKDNLLIFIEK